MGEWTLALDESGQFEGSHIEGERDETVGLVVGGVLFPNAPREVETSWRKSIRELCEKKGLRFPPHATEFDESARNDLGALASDLVSKANGHWIAVVQDPSKRQTAELALVSYVRLLAEAIDLAGRVVASRRGSRLHVLPAQRSLRGMSLSTARTAQGRGGFSARDSVEKGQDLRALSEATVRDAMDALIREGSGNLARRPDLASLEVRSAASDECHPGILLADLLCNRIYRTLRETPSVSFSGLLGTLQQSERPAYVVACRGLAKLRTLDRALREIPPNLSRAAHVLTQLEGDRAAGKSEISVYRATVHGSASAARSFWDDACDQLPDTLPRRQEINFARTLAADAELDLAAKTGAYEATWAALERGWAGNSGLAVRVRKQLDDSEVAAKLYRLTIECANHRGDVESARQAEAEFSRLARHHRSVAMFAEALHVQNLSNVTLQNRLLAEPDHTPELLEALDRAATNLIDHVETAAEFLDLVRDSGAAVEPRAAHDTREPSLWQALIHQDPTWDIPDTERGRSYGTAARSRAFIGQLDEALKLALKSRSFFAGSPFQLRFNASVIARILLEQQRLDPRNERQTAIDPAFELAGCRALRTPNKALAKIEDDAASRFALDLWLKRILWCRDLGDEQQTRWIEGLAATQAKSLFSLLSSGELRSHPTELIGRHAGEVLLLHGETKSARAWLDLSIELCSTSPDGTMQRFADFTRLLIDGDDRHPTHAAHPGSSLKPSFEYR